MSLIKRTAKKRDLVILIAWPFVASAFSFLLDLNALISTLLFFAVPAIYFSIRMPRIVPKLLSFSIVLGGFFGIVVDYIMERTGGWYTPHSVIDPFRLFGFVTLEFLVWTILYIYLVVVVYELFLDTEPRHVIRTKRFPYLFRSGFIAVLLFALCYTFVPSLLYISYFYLILGLIFCVIPIACVLRLHPRLLMKFLLATVYFAGFSIVNEITGVTLGHWSFPGVNQHIGKVALLGATFPFEEFLFWILLGGMAVLSWYEHFADDHR